MGAAREPWVGVALNCTSPMPQLALSPNDLIFRTFESLLHLFTVCKA